MRVVLLLLVLVVCGPGVPASAAEWQWPLDGDRSVSRPFTPLAHRYAAGHRGADLPASPGVPVRAAGDGRVSYAGLVAGRGVVVVVHGPLRTTYEPVTALVGVGSPVAAGDVVGTLDAGHLGCPVAACLHWGLRRGDDHLDPVRLVDPGPVRLLPLDGAATAGLHGGGRASVIGPVPAEPGAGRAALRAPAPAAARPAAPAAPGPAPPGVAAVASLLGAVAAATALRRRR